MLSFSPSCLVGLWFCLSLVPATEALNYSNQSQVCFPIQCDVTSAPSQTCDSVLCGAPSCCYGTNQCLCFIDSQYSSEVQCRSNDEMHEATKKCSFILLSNCSRVNDLLGYMQYNCNISTKSTGVLNSRVDTESVYIRSVLTTNLLTSAMIMNSPLYSTISTSNLVTVTNSINTSVVVPVIAGVLPVCLLLLLLVIVIGSIPACTLYRRRRAKQKTERHLTDTQEQLSMPLIANEDTSKRGVSQRISVDYDEPFAFTVSDNLCYYIENTPMATNPAYGILATSVITQENISYGVRQTQNPVAPAGVDAGTVYSTVVRQNRENVTIKLDTTCTRSPWAPACTSHTEEEEPGVQTAFNDDHTFSLDFPNTSKMISPGESAHRREGIGNSSHSSSTQEE